MPVAASSAGVRVDLLDVAGEPTCPEMPYDELRPQSFMIDRPAEHSATQLSLDLVRDSDLIIVFEPSHRSQVVQLQPKAQLRTFSLRQIDRLAAALNEPEWPESAPPPTGDVLRDLNLARSWAPFNSEDTVPDPHGKGLEAHRQAADVVDDCMEQLFQAFRERHTF